MDNGIDCFFNFLYVQDMPRQRHGRRRSVVSYDTGVKPPKPGVSRY
ncbi:hypothetical protein HMPREF3197_01797 [Klebsiella pneumoniae]|nr:hypothetical protein HMPREF3197_01797 [Klebsiella pneumoniae]